MAIALDQGSRLRDAMQAWETARRCAESYGSDLLCQVIGNSAFTSARMGHMQQAVALGEQALELALKVSDGFDQQVLEQQLSLGHHLRNVGRYDGALRYLQAAAAGFDRGGRDLKSDVVRCLLIAAWVQLGQHQRALQLADGDNRSSMRHMRAMRLAYRALALQAADRPALEPIRESLALWSEPETLWYRTHCLIATCIVPADEGLALALEVVDWALGRERMGLALAAQARAARCALTLGEPERALRHLKSAEGLAQSHQPDLFYLPELWWLAAQVNRALKRRAACHLAVEQGSRWVLDVATASVPELFRDSFLHRNRINADLLAWAR